MDKRLCLFLSLANGTIREVSTMQRVTNCILIKDNKVLLLQKPRRGWWVAPGGKMEPGESVKEAVKREYLEETGIIIKNPEISGIFTIIIKDLDNEILSEWMMFTFKATQCEGEKLEQSPEGHLEWKALDEIRELPMAEGDHLYFQHILTEDRPIYGTFHYTPDFTLISYRLEPHSPLSE